MRHTDARLDLVISGAGVARSIDVEVGDWRVVAHLLHGNVSITDHATVGFAQNRVHWLFSSQLVVCVHQKQFDHALELLDLVFL
jgi:hypothetical protein